MTLEMSNALRPGELFALRWSCFNPADSTIRLKETVYKGHLRPWGKTKRSLCIIPLAEELVPELCLWRRRCPDSSGDAFILPNAIGGFLDPGNYLERVLKKLPRELDLPKLTFQVVRRTIATLGQTKGSVKSIQAYCGTRESRLRLTCTCKKCRKGSVPPLEPSVLNSADRKTQSKTRMP